jgi:hypothetical protein
MDYKHQLSSRLKLILDNVFKGNMSRFGHAIGMTEGSIRGYIVGKKDKDGNYRLVVPSAEVIATIADNVGINSEWLLLGRGEMLKKDEDANKSPELLLDRLENYCRENERLRLELQRLNYSKKNNDEHVVSKHKLELDD